MSKSKVTDKDTAWSSGRVYVHKVNLQPKASEVPKFKSAKDFSRFVRAKLKKQEEQT